MEIVKTNETYQISDTKAEKGWKMTGTVTKDTIGSTVINFYVTKSDELGGEVGNGHYNKEPNSDRVNINYSTYESKETDFVTYMQEIVETVKTNFAE